MANGYTREQIIDKLKDHFRNEGFRCEEYSARWLGEVRLPLYCEKRWRDEDGKENEEEIVVDVITESTVSKDLYLPPITVQSVTVEDACPPRFFQYYLPRAKVFWAYGYYVSRDDGYESFVKACVRNGIGLIEVSDDEVVIVENAKSLIEGFEGKAEESTENAKSLIEGLEARVEESKKILLNESDFVNRMHFLTEMFCEEYIHRFVYYGDSVFRRREIIGRNVQDLSLLLIDKLQEVNNIQYHDKLIGLANDYRKEAREDYQIALETIQSLWQSRFQMEYPDIQKSFEAVLQLDLEYRDHFLHEFQVFLLGALIIDRLYDTPPIRSFEKLSGSTLEDAWLAASTYHDFNYPVEKCEGWMKELFKQFLHIKNGVPVSLNLEGVVVRDDFLSKMKDICATINYNMDDCIVRFVFEKAVLERNHAALATLSFLNKFENNSWLTTPATNQAALAIFLHEESIWKSFCGRRDCTRSWEVTLSKKRIMANLTFDSLPLAFLLAYCDTAQEWGRVGRNYEIARPELVDITVNGQQVLVDILVEDDSSYRDKRKEIERLKRFLKDDRFGLRIQSRTGLSKKIRMTGR